jgi:predicted deacylase
MLSFFAACAPRNATAGIPTQPSPIIQVQKPSTTPRPTLPPTSSSTLTRTLTPTLTSTVIAGQPVTIGLSAGGLPLEVVRFGNGAARRMIVAGIHGGYEYNTVELADQLIAYLREHPALVPENQALYLLRALNPDGYARGKGPEARSNANGVDLNRNWDYFWVSDWQKPGCWDKMKLSAGDRPGSEPETRALAKFLLENKIEALISYHSAGLGIFAGGQPPEKLSESLARRLSSVSGYQYPPKFTTCPWTGQFIDWASAHGMAAVDIELNNHTETDLAINFKVLKAFINWEK